MYCLVSHVKSRISILTPNFYNKVSQCQPSWLITMDVTSSALTGTWTQWLCNTSRSYLLMTIDVKNLTLNFVFLVDWWVILLMTFRVTNLTLNKLWPWSLCVTSHWYFPAWDGECVSRSVVTRLSLVVQCYCSRPDTVTSGITGVTTSGISWLLGNKTNIFQDF